jgi:hypothetical protein
VPGFQPANHYLIVSVTVTVLVVASGVTFTESIATEVESVVAFSVDEPVPHETNVKAIAKAKTVKVFIYIGFMLCLQLTYEDLRFLIVLCIPRTKSKRKAIGQRMNILKGCNGLHN